MATTSYRPSEWGNALNYTAQPRRATNTARKPAYSVPMPGNSTFSGQAVPSLAFEPDRINPYADMASYGQDAPVMSNFNGASPTGGFDAFDAQGAIPSMGFMDKLGIQLNGLKEMLPSEKSIFGGVDDKGMRTGGFAMPLVSALSGFGNIWNAKQNLDFQKEQFATSKAFGLANLNNSVASYNDQARERAENRKRQYGRETTYTPLTGM